MLHGGTLLTRPVARFATVSYPHHTSSRGDGRSCDIARVGARVRSLRSRRRDVGEFPTHGIVRLSLGDEDASNGFGVNGAPHQHFPTASFVRRLEPFHVGQTRRIDLDDVKVPGLFPELRVGVREEILRVGERLDRAEDVEIFGEEAVPSAADGELAVEPTRGAEVEEGVLVGVTSPWTP